MKATDQNIKKCLANPGRPHMNQGTANQMTLENGNEHG